MKTMISPSRLGGLRDICSRLLETQEECHINWLKKSTETESIEAERTYETFMESITDEESNKFYDVIWPLVLSREQSAYEQGMKIGAQLVMELIGG